MEKKDSLGRDRRPEQNAGRHGAAAKGDGAPDLIQPPGFLSEQGREAWQWARDHMEREGVLDTSDEKLLEVWACVYEEYRQAKDEVDTHGIMIECESDRGFDVVKKNPACSVAHAKLVMIKSLLHEMGIGPRNRFDKGEEKDPLAEFMLS